MKIHCIRHEPFEGLASIESWIKTKEHQLSYTLVYLNQEFPETIDFEMLIIMGGTSSVYDEEKPWISEEKLLISKSIEADVKILGICFGAQLIANVLGAKVYPGKEKEIGWFPIRFTGHLKRIIPSISDSQVVFHWHGDTFSLPEHSECLASSEITQNQGFLYKRNVLALQFHLEMNQNSIDNIVRGAGSELAQRGQYIQSRETIHKDTVRYLEDNNQLMIQLLEYLEHSNAS